MKIGLILCAAALASATPALSAGLFNGGFEQPAGPTPQFPGTGSIYISGWTVVDTTADNDNDVQYGDNADYGAVGVVASEGTHYLDLTGNTGHGKGVVQTVSLTAGKAYRVGFDVGAFWVGGYGSFGDAVVDLSIDGGAVVSFLNVQDLTSQGTDWKHFTYDFVAGPTTTLQFISSTSAASSTLGVGFDNVTLTAVPEPATWGLMVGGFAAVGIAARRRRTSLAA